jgi:heme exporter protein D
VYNILSYTYVYLLVSMSYLIVHCTVMDHLILNKQTFQSLSQKQRDFPNRLRQQTRQKADVIIIRNNKCLFD